jgi:hypothetical protein
MRLLIDVLSLTLFCLIGCLFAMGITSIGIILFNKLLAWCNKLMQKRVNRLKLK